MSKIAREKRSRLPLRSKHSASRHFERILLRKARSACTISASCRTVTGTGTGLRRSERDSPRALKSVSMMRAKTHVDGQEVVEKHALHLLLVLAKEEDLLNGKRPCCA